jgi:hypothetical protein
MKGTIIAPESKLKLIPSAGFKWTKGKLGISGSFEYQKTEFYKNGPIWARFGISYSVFFDNIRAPGKDLKWY